MSAPTFDVTYAEQRNRLTVAFRIILGIPHLIVAQLWGYVVQILAVIQWFIVLFTGKRNEGIWNFQSSWWHYYGRVNSYTSLLHDVFPPFGTEAGSVPVQTHDHQRRAGQQADQCAAHHLGHPGCDHRHSAVRRCLRGRGHLVVRHRHHGQASRGMWDFIHKAMRYMMQLQAYSLLMTDSYPKYG